MDAHPAVSPLRWILGRPWSRPGRLLVLLVLSLCVAPLRVATIAALLPVLQLLLHEDGPARLRAAAAEASPWLQPAASAAAEFATRGSALEALGWTLAAVLLLALLRGVLTVIQEQVAARLVHGATAEVAFEVHESLLRGAGDDAAPGELLAHFSSDLEAVRAALRRVYVRVLREPFHLLAALGFLVWIDWKLALWTGVAFPVAAAVLLLLSRRMKRASRRSLQRTAGMLSVAEEGLHGRREVLSYGLQDRERGRFRERFTALTRERVRLDRQQALSSPLLEILALVGAVACSLFGLRQVLAGSLPAETFLTFYAVLLSVMDPLRKLADTQVRVQQGAAAATRLMARVQAPRRPPPVHGTRPWPHPASIELEGVGVRSAEGSAILREIGLRLRPGDNLLLAGASGAGKSTLLDVLAGLRAVDEGTVRIGGLALAELDPDAFRDRVTLVSSHCFLFRGTLRENLELGRPPRRLSLDEALAAAEMDARVASLPRGLDTLVEELPFSAGERQRLSLARALYRDPEVLLLDEATSALDRPREESILQNLLRSRTDRITVLITHRLGLHLPVDRAVLLQAGRKVAEGPPEELLLSSTAYRSLAEGTAG